MRSQYLVLGLVLIGAGCTTMQVINPADVIPAQHPISVVLQKSNGEVVEVLNPQVAGGHLTGTRAQIAEPFDVALTDITWVKAKENNAMRTWVAAVGGVAVGAGVLYEITQSSGTHASFPCSFEAEVNHQCEIGTVGSALRRN